MRQQNPINRTTRRYHIEITSLDLPAMQFFYEGVVGIADSPFVVESEGVHQGFLLGCFGKSGNVSTRALLVNMDYNNAVTVTLKASGAIDIFHAPTDVWTSSPTHLRAKLDLPPGGGVLTRLK